jgi:hypothetical protein
MNRLLMLTIFYLVFAAEVANSQQPTQSYFGKIEFTKVHVGAWMNADPENLFTRTPILLSGNKIFCDRVEQATMIAIDGNYFCVPVVTNEIVTQAKRGNYSALFGWTEVLSIQGINLAEALIGLLSSRNSMEYNFAICYSIDTLIDSITGPKEVFVSPSQIKRMRNEIRKKQVRISGRKIVDGDYCIYLNNKLAGIGAKKVDLNDTRQP